MSPQSDRKQSDRKLRRLVADLAGATPEDIQAVLSGLEESQRERVEALLAEYGGERPGRPAPAAGALSPVLQGLSPWLADRLARAALASADRRDEARIWATRDLGFSMTPTALSALHKATLSLRAETPSTGQAAAGGGWFARLRGVLSAGIGP